ncbi:MAG: glycosyltransferase family 4 protein [Acidimicrobiia bacterium]|nr:glycosyltransferase family 4 protein [Acidimicrobiia bacterium]
MAPPLRVAYTIEQCWHRVPGGTAQSAIDLALAMGERNDVELVGVAARHRHPPDAAFQPPMPVRHLSVPRRALYELWHRAGWPDATMATGPVDVVHGTGGATPPRRGTPLVVTVHDLAVLHHPDFFTANGRFFLRAAIETARQRADLVICPSQATVDDCLEHGFDPDRTVRVAHGVDAAAASADAVAEVRARYRLPERFVLFVGTAEPRKNLATLIAALAQLDDPQPPPLVLVGPDGWGGVDTDPSPGSRKIELRSLGFVPRVDLGPLYAAATVFCYPSLLEGFGLPVLEAMAQGTPVVTSRDTATAEVVGDGGLLADARDPASVAGALAEVLGETDPDTRWGRAGAARAATYTWPEAAAQTVAAYQRAVAP